MLDAPVFERLDDLSANQPCVDQPAHQFDDGRVATLTALGNFTSA
ncbi:hypothetical protein C7S17_4256 [Burkholderia thailandensis]|nr:hypothetical protein [Burkholderia thailandensis]